MRDPPPSHATELLDPEEASRYEIIRLLGRGGMGEVFLARDRKLGRLVALKILRVDWNANPDGRSRILREVQAMSAVVHPGVVRLYDANIEGDRCCFTMEYVEGEPLSTWLLKRSLKPPELAALTLAIAEALAAVHEVSVAHRDLKPANVIIDTNGAPHLTDFGLATFIDRATMTALTRTGNLVGTMKYLPPEAFQGVVDGKSTDAYQVGVILYLLLTGVHPYEDASLKDIVSGDALEGVRPPCALTPDIPDPLSDLCWELMTLSWKKRPTVAEAATRLRAWLDEQDPSTIVAELPDSSPLADASTSVPPAKRPFGPGIPLILTLGLCLLLLFALTWSVPPSSESAPSIGKLRIEPRRLTAQLENRHPRPLTWRILDKSLQVLSHGRTTGSGRIVVRSLSPGRTYHLAVKGDGPETRVELRTPAPAIVGEVEVHALKGVLLAEFTTNLRRGVTFAATREDGKWTTVSLPAGRGPVVIRGVGKSGRRPLCWRIAADGDIFAHGTFLPSPRVFQLPGRAYHLKKRRSRGAPWLRPAAVAPPVWSADGRHVLLTSTSGWVLCYGTQPTPRLAWAIRTQSNPFPSYFVTAPAGLVQVVADGTFLVATPLHPSEKEQGKRIRLRCLDLRQREKLWRSLGGSRWGPKLPPWASKPDSRWYRPLPGEWVFDLPIYGACMTNGTLVGKQYFLPLSYCTEPVVACFDIKKRCLRHLARIRLDQLLAAPALTRFPNDQRTLRRLKLFRFGSPLLPVGERLFAVIVPAWNIHSWFNPTFLVSFSVKEPAAIPRVHGRLHTLRYGSDLWSDPVKRHVWTVSTNKLIRIRADCLDEPADLFDLAPLVEGTSKHYVTGAPFVHGDTAYTLHLSDGRGALGRRNKLREILYPVLALISWPRIGMGGREARLQRPRLFRALRRGSVHKAKFAGMRAGRLCAFSTTSLLSIDLLSGRTGSWTPSFRDWRHEASLGPSGYWASSTAGEIVIVPEALVAAQEGPRIDIGEGDPRH